MLIHTALTDQTTLQHYPHELFIYWNVFVTDNPYSHLLKSDGQMVCNYSVAVTESRNAEPLLHFLGSFPKPIAPIILCSGPPGARA